MMVPDIPEQVKFHGFVFFSFLNTVQLTALVGENVLYLTLNGKGLHV